MSKTDLRAKFRRGGFYWDKNQPYISVTTILDVLDKSALRWWFGREVYRAMVVDPTLSEKAALGAPYKLSKQAMGRGTLVHNVVEKYKHTREHIDKVPENIRPYAEAFFSWVDQTDMEMKEHEKTVISKKHGYAGTLDLTVLFKKTGRLCILDVKTGKNIYDDVFLQLSAYKQALYEMEGVDADIAVLLLETGKDNKPTGHYKFKEGDYNFPEFLAAKKLWIWKNQALIASLKKYIKDSKGRR